MTDKPTVLDWHRLCANDLACWIKGFRGDPLCLSALSDIVEIIAAHDPHDDCDRHRAQILTANEKLLALTEHLQAENARLTSERDEARHLFESTDLHRGRLFAENNRLRKALEEIAYIDTSENQYAWRERMDEVCAIAAAALEGKD